MDARSIWIAKFALVTDAGTARTKLATVTMLPVKHVRSVPVMWKAKSCAMRPILLASRKPAARPTKSLSTRIEDALPGIKVCNQN